MDAINWSDLIGWKWDGFHLGAALLIVTRAWHASGGWKGFTNRGGIVGIVKALLYGTNTPTPPPTAKP